MFDFLVLSRDFEENQLKQKETFYGVICSHTCLIVVWLIGEVAIM